MPTVRPELDALTIPIDSIRPHPRNPRVGDVAAIASSLAEHGQYRPIVVRAETREILAGNHTWRAAVALGWSEIAAVLIDCDEERAERILLADNRYADLAGYDNVALLGLLRDLAASETGLIGTGYTTTDLADLIEGIDKAPVQGLTDVDAVPDPPAKPTARPGDVWLLGPHRLYCGDALEPDSYEALLGLERADAIVTDPPYNVGYEGKTADALTIDNDRQADAAFGRFLEEAFTAMAAPLHPGGPVYVFHSDTGAGETFRAAFRTGGLELHQVIVWVKHHFVMGRQDYHWQHEPILYGWKPGAAHPWYGGRNRSTLFDDDVDLAALKKGELLELLEEIRATSTVLREKRPARSSEHPTMKPVRLIARLLSNSTRAGNIVLDPFAGSGSTLIAAHQTGRVARMIELDPRYVDVICRRWEDHTGQRATRETKKEGTSSGKARTRAQANQPAAAARRPENPPRARQPKRTPAKKRATRAAR